MCMIIPIPKQSCEPSLACTKMMSRENSRFLLLLTMASLDLDQTLQTLSRHEVQHCWHWYPPSLLCHPPTASLFIVWVKHYKV